jgi:hypothetical protein
VPVDIWLNKYADPRAGKKVRLYLRDGRIISHDRRGAEDVLELLMARIFSAGTFPAHLRALSCRAYSGHQSLFERDPQEVSRTTRAGLRKLSCC